MKTQINLLARHPDTPFYNFYHDGQTPADAVALAIADHRAGKIISHEFLDALRKAETILRSLMPQA